MDRREALLFAAAEIEHAIRYAKGINKAFGDDESILRYISSHARSLRQQALEIQRQRGFAPIKTARPKPG